MKKLPQTQQNSIARERKNRVADVRMCSDKERKLQRRCMQEYNFEMSVTMFGACGSVVAKALCYKPEGRGFETR
jgi:hypothetical protein